MARLILVLPGISGKRLTDDAGPEIRFRVSGIRGAYDRYDSGTIFSNACGNLPLGIEKLFETKEKVLIFPNPVQSEMTIESSHFIQNLRIINSMGQEVHYQKNIGLSNLINTADWKNGVYLVLINFSNNKSRTEIVVKTNSL